MPSKDSAKRKAQQISYYATHRAEIIAKTNAHRKKPENLERYRLWRRAHKRKQRRDDGAQLRSEMHERDLRRLAEANGRQAWRYWIYVLAPAEWIDRYWAASPKPWNNPRLTEASYYRLRYRLDPIFAERERRRVTIRRFANSEYAAVWDKDDNGRWYRAVASDDGTVTKEFMKALLAETHCAYCLRPIVGTPHVDHVYPLRHGGKHSADNLALSCSECNHSKRDTLPLAYLVGITLQGRPHVFL